MISTSLNKVAGPTSTRLVVDAPQGEIGINYMEWTGPPDSRTVICAHGLTRNSRDFDFLARQLSTEMTVICPDMPGRGESDWLNGGSDYGFPTYLRIAKALVAHLAVDSIDWVGTSMGGILGMQYAAESDNPIRKLVLNDVGAVVPKAALRTIARYVGDDPLFDTLDQLEDYLRDVHCGFGKLSDEQWRHMAEHSHRMNGTKFALKYDPKIGDATRWMRWMPLWLLTDAKMWDTYDAITCPTLLLRGEESTILQLSTAKEMTKSGPKAELIEFAEVGHAPALMSSDQTDAIKEFLTA
jgi:pimeloyl-ACP methyl ester carboxylesterase